MGKGTRTESVSVSFGVDDSTTVEARDLSISLDRDRNSSVYGVENKSQFLPGETAYLKVIASHQHKPMTLHSSMGSVRFSQSGVLFNVTEEIQFTYTDSGTLRHLPYGGISYRWIGKSAGTPKFEGKKVSLSSPGVGVLECTYKVSGRRATLTVSSVPGDESVSVLVVVVQDEKTANTSVTYSGDDSEEAEPVPVTLRVRDFCSDDSLDNVLVYVNGVFKGATTIEGTLYIGLLRSGSVHDLLMTKEGYIDSNLDVLYNDSFTVPDSSETGEVE